MAVRAAAAVVSRAAVALRAPVARFSAESDDAFKPKSKVKADDPKAFAEKMDRARIPVLPFCVCAFAAPSDKLMHT